MPRQYAACKYRPTDTATKIFHWDGDPLSRGDVMKIANPDGPGFIRVEVVSISQVEPSFSTDPIVGQGKWDIDLIIL